MKEIINITEAGHELQEDTEGTLQDKYNKMQELAVSFKANQAERDTLLFSSVFNRLSEAV